MPTTAESTAGSTAETTDGSTAESRNAPRRTGRERQIIGMRVEELAEHGDVSVDTIRFYQKLRLLPPPARVGRVAYYGAHHADRLAQIRALQARGLTLALIGRVVRGELDVVDAPLAAAVDATEIPEHLLTRDELAAEADVPPELIDLATDEGLLVARLVDSEPRYSPDDARVVRAGVDLLDQGLPLAELIELAREHHAATRRIAESAVALFDEHIRRPLRDADLDDEERAQRLVVAFEALFPAVSALVEDHFRRVLLQVAREHLDSVGEPTEIAAASTQLGWSG